MPYTPYHIGPSGFVGLLLRRWLDVPMFLLANVLIDLEVLADNHLAPGWPVHQLWHLHTLLIGGTAGAALGAAFCFIKPLRRLCELAMMLIGLPQKARLWPMVAGGWLGAWLHIVIDSVYHYDVQIFWPHTKNPIHTAIRKAYLFNQGKLHRDIELICLVFWGLLIGWYLLILLKKVAKTWKTKI